MQKKVRKNKVRLPLETNSRENKTVLITIDTNVSA